MKKLSIFARLPRPAASISDLPVLRLLQCALLALSLAFLPPTARAESMEEDYNEHTIRASDLPPDAPRFEQYPAQVYHGPIARPDVRSHPRSRIFRTMIRTRLKDEGVNFAGHMSVVTWGCGMGCRCLAFVDTRNGHVYHPENLQAVDNNNVGFDDFLDADGEWNLLRFRPDSRLLVVIGGINEEGARRGISYFLWDNGRMKRIRFTHKAYE